MPINSDSLIVDTSCLILLSKINEISLLKLPGRNLFTTPQVQKEFKISLPSWIEIIKPQKEKVDEIINMNLDAGEASAIALAMDFNRSILIIDDLKGRKVADLLNVHYSGTLGLILRAKQEGILPSGRLEMGRDTVKTYLKNLEDARLLNLLARSAKGVASLQKPDKIYIENTNFSYTLKKDPDPGTLRETFFVNQMRNAGHSVELAKNGDFLVDRTWTFEIGGSSKNNSQIQYTENAFLALDDLELPYLNRIPLWLFGFLY